MTRVLLVTVGGSPQPIITAVKELKPDRIIFLCSTGKNGSDHLVIGGGFPCEIRAQGEVVKQLPNLPTHLQLHERFQADRDVLTIQDPDNLAECYQRASDAIQELLTAHDKHHIFVDYTGGTKTMSLALGMAGIQHDVNMFVTTGARTNRMSISKGERPEKVAAAGIRAQQRLKELLPVFLSSYNYPAAVSELKYLLRSEIPDNMKNRIRNQLDYCLALDAWDRFDHANALDFLNRFMRRPQIKPLLDFLKRVMHSRADIQEEFVIERLKLRYHGYEVVEDLLLNAERRAKQARYDDAVGRIYRALELLMQIHFKKHHAITTAGVAPEELAALLQNAPQQHRDSMLASGKSRIQFGITRGYELLRDIPNDPLGALYKQYEGRLSKVLKIRNLSLFAHGFRPIEKEDYDQFYDIAEAFVEHAIKTLTPDKLSSPRIQFPEVLEDIF